MRKPAWPALVDASFEGAAARPSDSEAFERWKGRRPTDLDAKFDAAYPAWVRKLSGLHWTPIGVIRKVVELLELRPLSRVLDVGCGPGKFCLVGAMLSPASFVGVERRARLVAVATRAGKKLGVANATFVEADALELDWRPYTHLYLYNPFEEQLFEGEERIDDALEFTRQGYQAAVGRTHHKLSLMPLGTTVVLFHGYGGELPAGYERTWSRFYGSGRLERWRKVQPSGEGPDQGAA